MLRKTYAEINEETLKSNIKNIKQNYGGYKYYFGVVKGNAYGHGFHTVNALIEGGINYLAVATPDEALKVREFNSEIPVLCLEPADFSAINAMLDNNITLTVDSLNTLDAVLKVEKSKSIKVHLKIDSGMNRLGFKDPHELKEAFKAIKESENITLEGIFTHLATSGLNDSYYDRQIDNFYGIINIAGIDLNEIPIIHIDRSLTLVHHGKQPFVNGVRLGICMYGFAQSLNEPTGLRKIKRDFYVKKSGISDVIFKNQLDVKTAMSLYTEVIAVKQVKKGEFAGYGAEYVFEEDGYAATLAIGYYDGIPDGLKTVNINGKNYKIIGEHCMDMISVKADESVKAGDRAEIFGDKVSVKSAAAQSGISSYKLLCSVSSRVPRIYGEEELYI